MAHAARPWAYKVNYDREITEDLKQIAITERHIPLAAVLREEERSADLSIVSFLFLDVARRAPLLGLSATDVADLWWFCDLRDGYYGYTAPEPDKDWSFARLELQAFEQPLREIHERS